MEEKEASITAFLQLVTSTGFLKPLTLFLPFSLLVFQVVDLALPTLTATTGS